ncbi:RHS repeat-associated core domain-containing protein [Pseudomonas asiatica]|uniref:RHS repeat-associated core domain-containing protein n=1 Tax=Pseudomonas asiatica TaxID=2219225 RepID=UPI003BA2D0E8|nr:RHS repeat-associated core domain-containing protein [Pseudomonas shirazica]
MSSDTGTVYGEVANEINELSYTPYGFGAYNDMEGRKAFNGEKLDFVTSGYLLGNGHRQFAPRLMRFLSPDNLSPFNKGGINSYVYCASDPVNGLDPSGRVNITKLFMPRLRTGTTGFMKEKSLPTGLLKKLLKKKSADERRSIYVYEAQDDGYKHYGLARGEAPELLPRTATHENFAGREIYVKGGLIIDLKGDSMKDYNFSATDRVAGNYGFVRVRSKPIAITTFEPNEAGAAALEKEMQSWFTAEEWNGSGAPGFNSNQDGLNAEIRQIRR